MYESTTQQLSGAPAVSTGHAPAGKRHFPLEHEQEFAEVEAKAEAPRYVFTTICAGLLFHALLISERAFLGVSPKFFVFRGVPVTLGLLGVLLFAPALRRHARLLLCLVTWGAVVALVAGVDLSGAGALLPLETGIAALVLLCGWSAHLPVMWTAVLSGGMIVADLACLAAAPGGLTMLKADALFAPIFAAAYTLLSASVRQKEARREFLAIRTAAFAGVEAEPAPEESTHLDPVSGVGNRAAFDMRLRAAWEQAATRRNSVALLMFSIDDFAQKKRDHGHRYGDMLQLQVAGMLKEGLRRSDDMVARFDVHHFVVMLPGVGTDGATQIAERLRGCIEELVVYVGTERHRATVTVGVASVRAKRNVTRDRLIEAASQALEVAKHTGPNTVCVEGRGCLPKMA